MTQEQALTILKTGANVFLTGEPGSGKTHTINAYVSYLREHGVEPAITASTGIAATHIHGQTIHSWSGLGIRRTLSPYDLDHLATTEYLVKRLRNTSILIIDEISMIDATTLDMIDLILREVRHTEDAFGGIQIVLVGDFFQLPPVSSGESRFAFEGDAWRRARPVVCYLTEQHRQSDDKFLSVLGAIRDDSYDELHHELLLTRKVASMDHTGITKLFSHNADVDAINTRELDALPGLPTIYTMDTKGRASLVESLKKGCLSPEVLALKPAAVVMCTKNNLQKGYVNGTLGTVVGFESGTKYPIIETRAGDRIIIEPVDWIVEEDGKQKAAITQIPLRLAWAITIHKSQGMSLDAAVMDLGNIFEYGQGYVALSRVKSLDGLHLLGWNRQAFQVHPRIKSEDTRLRQQSETAEALFGDMTKDVLLEMQHNFIRAAGGTVDVVKKKEKKIKEDTLTATLELILQGKSLKEISKTRTLAVVTILGHIEKLAQEHRIEYADVEYLFEEKTLAGLTNIKRTFVEYDTSKLTPIYEHYKGKYSFDQLRLARIAITLGAA